MDKDPCPYMPIGIDPNSTEFSVLVEKVLKSNKNSNVANAFCISIYCASEIVRHLIFKGSLPNTRRNKMKCGLHTNG